MTPQELVKAARQVESQLDDAAIVYVDDSQLVVDWDTVWPECRLPNALCEGAGEYRRVAHISSYDGTVTWFPMPPAGEGHNE